MENKLLPIYNDQGQEVSRKIYVGQTQLGEAIGTTAIYVGVLLRRMELLEQESRTATAEALETGAAIYVTQETRKGKIRYVRWKKDLVLDALAQALEANPKPTHSKVSTPPTSSSPAKPLEGRVEALERRIEKLERLLQSAGQ